MSVTMPKLEEGRIYRRFEVAAYIGEQGGTSDYDVVAIHFPRDLDNWQHDGLNWRADEEMLLQYHVYSLTDFKEELYSLEDTFSSDKDERQRVEAIGQLLLDGKPFFPVFMQQNDHRHRIIEGMHRAVALLQLESQCLPAFLTGYRDWFADRDLEPSFKQEDEIAPGTLRDAWAFFLHAICVDQKGNHLGLFDSARLARCDEALVARYNGRIVGVATMAIRKSTPMLDTVYVLKQYRSKGVAYRLCGRALQRFQDAGVQQVFCDVQSVGMNATLEKMGRERPDLRALIIARIEARSGEGVEFPDKDLIDE